MKLDDAPKFIADIFKLGNWRLILALFGCVSAFTIGAIIELGVNFLPIIDKAHMVSVMGFYVVSFYVFFAILLYLWRYFIVPSDVQGGRQLFKIAFFDAVLLFVVIGALFGLSFLAESISDKSYGSRNWSFVLVSLRNAVTMGIQNTFLTVMIALFWFILALRRCLRSLIPKFFGEISDLVFRRVSNHFSLILVALSMMIFLESGSVWMRIAYFQPPSMIVSYVEPDQPSVEVNIVMRAEHGFIGIADGNRYPEYFGWNSIRRITPVGRQ